MARLADIMRDSTIRTLKGEMATGSLHAQLLAFRENLIPDLSVDEFADMYAQDYWPTAFLLPAVKRIMAKISPASRPGI